MKTAIIVHGMPDKKEFFDIATPSSSNRHWLPWFQKQFSLKGILAQTPEMPEPYLPKYENWKKVFEQFNVNEETVLVGHSCGAGFLVRWLSENKNMYVDKVILVAPWLDSEESLATGMFDFEIDSELANRTKGVTVFYSTDDFSEILDTVKILKEKLPNAKYREFTGKGHFCLEDLKTDAFPELLEEILN